jgi:hypothetical protein
MYTNKNEEKIPSLAWSVWLSGRVQDPGFHPQHLKKRKEKTLVLSWLTRRASYIEMLVLHCGSLWTISVLCSVISPWLPGLSTATEQVNVLAQLLHLSSLFDSSLGYLNLMYLKTCLLGITAHTCYPSTWEAETGELRIWGQSRLHKDSVLKNIKRQNTWLQLLRQGPFMWVWSSWATSVSLSPLWTRAQYSPCHKHLDRWQSASCLSLLVSWFSSIVPGAAL